MRAPHIAIMARALTYAVLESRALIALSGPDWRSFLQGLITQDVETMAPGQLRFGALLTPQGRLLYDLFVVARDDGVWLDVEAADREAILQRLAMYRLRAKVEIVADDRPVSVVFPGARIAVSGHIPDPRLAELGCRGYGVGVPAAAILADESTYDAHRMALGVPGPADWGADKTYPIEANFDLLQGIDFQKGCFVGQETTSRMKRRGVIKSRMLPITFDGPPPAPGTEVLAGDLRAGVVTSGIDGWAMALVRLDRIDGALNVGGRPVETARPAWMPQ